MPRRGRAGGLKKPPQPPKGQSVASDPPPRRSVMSSTVYPTLHRFVPRSAIETSPYGYEVLADNSTVDQVLSTIAWIDCWCPDAAQFVLLDAPAHVTVSSSERLVEAIKVSQFGSRLRLVCERRLLASPKLVAPLLACGTGLLLDAVDAAALDEVVHQGILAIRLDAAFVAGLSSRPDADANIRAVLRHAHDLGLRSIASQVAAEADRNALLALGLDYVSPAGGGVGPIDLGPVLRLGSWTDKSRR